MLNHTKGRVVVKMSLNSKNFYKFNNGMEIQLFRKAENMDGAYVELTQGEIISGEGIPTGAELLFHFNAVSLNNRIFNVSQVSGDDIAAGIAYASIERSQCYCWKTEGGEWTLIDPFVLAKKVFKPYRGPLVGIEPQEQKNVLYLTSGRLAGNVVAVLKHSGYRIIFRNDKGQDETMLRCRFYEDDRGPAEMPSEVLAIHDLLTEQVESGEMYVGADASSAKPEPKLEIA